MVLIVVIIGLTSWMYLARIVRAEFLSLKENEFVLAARATDTSNFEIIFRYQIGIYSPADGNIEWLPASGGDDASLAWAPNGRMAYVHQKGAQEWLAVI